ncbi:radical SAM protein [Streptomyces sp. NPDC021224]|uniref:radical SAM protein n=1 Tax=unclassified Streptomyces TaxID=2593676 RepID=UPI00378B35F0
MSLAQPRRDAPFMPQEWIHRYHEVKLTRGSDGSSITVPCTAANFFLMDLNPRWYFDGLAKAKGKSLFILYLDTTNSCTDACPMCFTMATREQEGMNQRLDIDLSLTRIAELRERYPETFRMVSMAGPGEPLNLPRIEDLILGTARQGLAVRVYTAGRKLNKSSIRSALLEGTSLVRVSVDAASKDTYRATHAVDDFEERMESIRTLVGERTARGSGPLIGLHFVIQKANFREIIPFAEMARGMGCDFVVYGQETFGKVAGGFSTAEKEQVVADLAAVEAMHAPDFAAVVPRLVRRQTYTAFDKNYVASIETLNGCHNSRHRIFFGVQNDFSACWLATMDASFREESYIGKLSEESTMSKVLQIIDHGVGDGLGRPAKLSCNTCVAGNYNSMVDKVLAFLDGEDDWESEVIEHVPAQSHDAEYEFRLVGGSPDEVLSVGVEEIRSAGRKLLPVISTQV